jgi:hypothetical protein
MSESTTTIPIANIFAVVSKQPTGTFELSFRSYDGLAVPVPDGVDVLTSRFGVIETSFGNGFTYALGFHDIYTVRYLGEVVFTISPRTIMDVEVA